MAGQEIRRQMMQMVGSPDDTFSFPLAFAIAMPSRVRIRMRSAPNSVKATTT